MDEQFECRMEQIYGGQLRLSIRTPDKGERRSSLTVCAELCNTNGSTFRKELVIRLTDENDPFFHYQLKLNDEDYQSLRVQQGLLVDFLSFPQRFADLLELCRKEEMNEYPKFVLNFVTSTADGVGHLNVIETNPFKHLVHLSLRLVAGSDSDVKKHLAQRLAALSGQNEKLRADLRNTESDLGQRLHETRISLSARHSEVENLKAELREQATLLQTKWEQLLAREQEKSVEEYSDLQSRCNRELSDFRIEHEKTVAQLRNSLALAEARALDLGERRHGSESVMHDLRSKKNSLEDELTVARRALNDLSKEKKLLVADRDDAEARLTRLTSNTASLEQEVRTSESKAMQLRSLLDNVQEQNNKVTIELERSQSLLNKRETSLKTLAEEVNKGNDIIRKLQTEIKNLHSKLKVRNKVVEEQEKAVNGKEIVLDEMQRNLNSCREELKLRTEEAKKLQDNLDAAQTKLDESAKLARTNENVINWLNKQLNEFQVGNQRGLGAPTSCAPPFGSPFVTSTPAEQAVPSAILQYQPKLASVQVASKRPPFDAIPEDPNSPRVGKENNAPAVIDPKYLQPSRNNQRPRFVATNNAEPSAASVRLPRMSVAPPSARWPLAKSSAYFPS